MMRRGEIAARRNATAKVGSRRERPHGREVAIKAFAPVAAPVNAIRPEAATTLDRAPPDNAVVLAVDEKPSIQALERAQGLNLVTQCVLKALDAAMAARSRRVSRGATDRRPV
jgi:hypothetical protein